VGAGSIFGRMTSYLGPGVIRAVPKNLAMRGKGFTSSDERPELAPLHKQLVALLVSSMFSN
jgi:hypothetical protein